jgi:hypothetical protein
MTHTAKAYFKRGHGADPVVVTKADDVDQLIDALVAESWENCVAALYVDGRLNQAGVPDHELLVAVDYEDKAAGALRYMGGGTYFSKGNVEDDTSVLYYYMGSDREFPRGSVLLIADIRAAVKEFLQTGGDRPTSVEWREWPMNVS